MTRVAFYFDNQHLPELNYDTILDGNPGIGGTEYMIMVISRLLQLRDNDISPILYTTGNNSQIYHQAVTHPVHNINEAIIQAECDGCKVLIFKHDSRLIHEDALKCQTVLRLIPWCHNIVYEADLDYYCTIPSIHKIVYVSKEHMDLYRDHKAFEKSIYIYNCIKIDDSYLRKISQSPTHQRKNIVTYMGAIIPEKGLHWLIDVWHKVVERIPDAELHIIGSGKLYTHQQTLGINNIAESQYETYLFRQHSKTDLETKHNVHFLGVMGAEKEQILLQTKVGVPNPSGRTETFCISSIEMQLCGASVVTGKSPGSLETTINGRICTHKKNLADHIIKELQKDEIEYLNIYNNIKERFSQNSVATQWENLLLDVKEEIIPYIHKTSHLLYRWKFVKEILRKIKKRIPCLYGMPSVERCILFIERHTNIDNKARY